MAKTYDPSDFYLVKDEFITCLKAAEIITMTLLERRKEAECNLKMSIAAMKDNNVISITNPRG